MNARNKGESSGELSQREISACLSGIRELHRIKTSFSGRIIIKKMTFIKCFLSGYSEVSFSLDYADFWGQRDIG
jgi:hypothetical protein